MPRTNAAAGAEGDLATRLAALEERLTELEADEYGGFIGRADYAIERMLGAMLPPDARGHMRAARKEQLLAARSFIDHWIERLDRPPAAHGRAGRGPGRRSSRAPRRRESIAVE